MKENHGLNLGQLIFHLNLSQISNHDHMRISWILAIEKFNCRENFLPDALL